MTWQIFWDLALRIGLPGAAGFGLAWLIWIGKIRPNREFTKVETDAAQDRADWERQLADLRRDFERQLVDMTKERDFWRDTSMDMLQRYDRELSTSEAAVGTAVRALGRRRS